MTATAEQAIPARATPRLDIVTDIAEAQWDRFVAERPDASFYHFWRWRHVFEGAFGHKTVYLAAKDGSDVVGVLPLVVFRSALFGRFAVSLPFVNYGGVCAINDAVGRQLVECASQVAIDRGLTHVEMRHTSQQFPDLPFRAHKVGMLKPLQADIASVWSGMAPRVRNQIRKAQKGSLTTRHGGRELIDRFYGVFAQNMRDLGTPVYSIRLFEHVLANFPQAARVFLVDDGDRTVAGGIAIIHRNTIEFPWASSLREYRTQLANYLLYWNVIEYAVENGLSVFDFGRSSPNDGPYEFKCRWGAEPQPLHWEYALVGRADLPDLSRTNQRFRAAIETWKRLPLPVTNFVGPRIVRSIP